MCRHVSVGLLALLTLSLALGGASIAACGGDNGPPLTTLTTTSSVSSTPSTSPTSSSAPPTSLEAGDLSVTTVAEGLRIPWEMRFLPDGRLLVTEREGRVVIVDVASGAVTEVGSVNVLVRGEGGLMGLALDPGFPDSPYIYVSYTHVEGGDASNRLSRFTLSGLNGPGPALGDEEVLLDGIPAGSNHNGSRVAFGPDGILWVTTGDSGNSDLAQRMDSLAGKVLRMTADGQPPQDNPFLDRPYPFSLIYTLGHRNPQGLAFHPVTGSAYVTEHGPNDNDEVNRLQSGGNYGWPDLRGKVNQEGFIDPIITWSPTIAPAGAVFYTGDLLSGLKGDFVFVTLKESDMRILTPSDPADFETVKTETIVLDERFGRLRPLAQGPDGALYAGTSNLDGRGDPNNGDDRIIRIGD